METTQQAPMTGEKPGHQPGPEEQQQAGAKFTGPIFTSPVVVAHDATERYLNTLYSGLASSGNTTQAQRIDALRNQAREFYRSLPMTGGNLPTREQALTITHFQQSIQWCVWSILTEPAR